MMHKTVPKKPSPDLSWREVPTTRDVGRVREIVKEAGVFTDEEIAVAGELVETTLKVGEEEGYRFLFAEQHGELAAYSCFGRIPLSDISYDLYWIVTAREAQGQGLASLLMAKTESIIKALGGKCMYAETSSREIYRPAQQFYLKQGFTEAARFHDFYRAGDSKLVFAKALG